MPILADFLLTDKDTLASQTTGPVNTDRIGRLKRGGALQVSRSSGLKLLPLVWQPT
jgi:hypothetical protein